MTRAVPSPVADAWAKVRRGATAPFVVVRKARLAGEPWRAYVRLVRVHLVLAVLVLAVAAPLVVGGVRSVSKHHDVSVTSHGVQVRAQADTTSDGDGTIEAPRDDVDPQQAFLATHAPSLVPLWIALGSLYAAWFLIELTISMLWMEHLDWLTEQLTRAVGLPVLQPIERAPRVRLNLRWAVQKAWRQILAALMIASGAPFFLLAYLAPKIGTTLYAIVLSLWTLYWVLVTTAAKSASAWAEPAPREPWFLRTWTTVPAKVPFVRWLFPRWYGAAWTWLTRALHPAALLWEARPYEFVGLAVVRAVASLPLVSIVVKPVLPTAAELIASGALDIVSDAPTENAASTPDEKSRGPKTA